MKSQLVLLSPVDIGAQLRPLELSTEGTPYLLDPVVRLSPLTVVIGANASGKSTLLKAVRRCLVNAEGDEDIADLPALFAWPESVDQTAMSLALVSIDGTDDMEWVIGAMWTDGEGLSREWAADLEDDSFLSDGEYFKQLPRLFRTSVSYRLFHQVVHRRKTIDIDALASLCRSMEPELRVGFRGGKVGVALSSDALRRLRPALANAVESGVIGAGDTVLETFAIRTLANDFEFSKFAWLRELADARADLDDYSGTSQVPPPLYLAYEKEQGSGIEAQVVGAAKQYLEKTIAGFESSIRSFHILAKADLERSELNQPVSSVDADSGAPSSQVEANAKEHLKTSDDHFPVSVSQSARFKLLRSTVPTTSVPPAESADFLNKALEHLKFSQWNDEGELRWSRPLPESNSFEVNPFVLFVVSRAEFIANVYSPSFIQKEGRIRISASPTSEGDATAVRIHFEVNGESIALENCSDGIAKYIVLSVQLALHMINGSVKRRGSIMVQSEVERATKSLSELHDALFEGVDYQSNELLEIEIAKLHGQSFEALIPGIPIDPGMSMSRELAKKFGQPAQGLSFRVPFNSHGTQSSESLNVSFAELPCRPVLLLDEPENHLHPSACRSVSEWLEDLDSWFLLVVVATHNAELMDVAMPNSEVLVAEKTSQGGHLSRRHHDILRQNKVLMDQMGMTPADLLLRSRYVLFVEGVHDKVVLETWFSSRLRRAGILVFPLHGLKNASRIPDSEFVWNVGVKVGILVDDLDESIVRDRVQGVSDKQSTEYEMKTILERWINAGRNPDVFGLSKKDILFYLDPIAVREHARDFTDWEAAYEEAVRAGQSSSKQWKAYVQREYGVGVSAHSEESVAEMCRTAQELELIPQEIREKIEEIIEVART